MNWFGIPRRWLIKSAAFLCKLPIPDSRFPTPDSRLPTPDSRFLIPDDT
ncbi:MAG: hypothetical protein F6K50_51660 [Moorea sp. SIO3I7]|nr:hypothetical protein [Moorena sp. SIO3I7]